MAKEGDRNGRKAKESQTTEEKVAETRLVFTDKTDVADVLE